MSQVCTHCGMPLSPEFKFCNVCGIPIEPQEPSRESVEPYSSLLGKEGRMIRIITGASAGRFVGVYPQMIFGRRKAEVDLSGDETLSVEHFCVEATDAGVILTDRDSLNGVMIRVIDKVVLRDDDIIRAGDHFFLYESYAGEKLEDNFGADFYASPSRGERFRLVEILRGGRRGRACTAPDGIIVGRTSGDFLIPEDGKMSAKHFTIRWTQRGGILIDHSSNGTFVQIHEPTLAPVGTTFFAGNSLFCVY